MKSLLNSFFNQKNIESHTEKAEVTKTQTNMPFTPEDVERTTEHLRKRMDVEIKKMRESPVYAHLVNK
jgi:hypothetical protein